MNELLNVEEKNELERCEVVIKQGLKTFVEVGQALMLIRDKRLYRSEFGTFENYCNEKWDLTRQHVNRLVKTSQVVSNLEPLGSKPQTETHARPLTKLEPELQQEAWQETINRHGSEITQKKVQTVVNEFVDINNELKEAKKEPLFSKYSKEDLLEKAKRKAQKERDLLDAKKAITTELITNVNSYDGNMFFVKERYNTSRFDDHIVNVKDNKYPTLTTASKLFDNNLVEYPLRFYSEVQTFPNDYKFCGPKTSIKTQIGNAVAPQMGAYISQFVKGKTVGDLFAGCGGFSCGFHKNGFETKWAIEWDKNAANSFKLNFQDTKVYNSNIVEFDTSVLDKVDVIIGGPPCKGFSNAGYQFKEDPRNLLYKEFLNVVCDLYPNQFIMENVLQVETIAEEIIKDFQEIGYSVETKRVDGNNIGMKQNRKRFFFIGTKVN